MTEFEEAAAEAWYETWADYITPLT